MISELCPLGLTDDELSRWHDDDLAPARMALVRTHLASCQHCRERLATYEEIGVGLRALQPPALDLERLMAGVYEGSASNPSVMTQPEMPLQMPARIPHRSRRMMTGTAGLAAVLVLSLLAGWIFATHGHPLPPTAKKITPSIVPDAHILLTAIGMSSPTDGWAVGRNDGSSSEDPGYVLHYAEGRWARVRNTPLKSDITAITMLSATNGWAIGNHVYHYDGVSWHEIHVPVSDGFNAISVVSPSNIWIAGGPTPVSPSDGHAVILHYDGYGWFQQPTPSVHDSLSINDLSMVSATEGWAVGTATSVPDSQGNTVPTGVVLHYGDGVWQLAKTLPNYDLRTISMATRSDGWLGGHKITLVRGGYPFPGGNPTDQFVLNEPILLRFTGQQWVEASVPQASEQPADYPEYGQIERIKMVSATQGWLFATFETQAIGPNGATYLAPSIFQLDNGRWKQLPAPLIQGTRYATLSQVNIISPNEFWGVGDCVSSSGTPSGTGYLADVTSLVVHYVNGTWATLTC